MQEAKIKTGLIVLFFCGAFLFVGCGREETDEPKDLGDKTMEMEVRSTVFEEAGMIPKEYTCDGDDISPPLLWENVPGGTKSIAIIADDPDAPNGGWVHWVVWNIPAEMEGLEENVAKKSKLDNGIMQGITDFGSHGYGGPCPPDGTHRYFFKVFALDSFLSLPEESTKDDLLDEMHGRILDEAQLMGRYERHQ